MFGLGPGELIIILIVALVVLGPKRLPDMASGLGKAIRDFKRATGDIQSQLEIDETVAKPLKELRSALNEPIQMPVVRSVASPAANPAAIPAAISVEGPPPGVVAQVPPAPPLAVDPPAAVVEPASVAHAEAAAATGEVAAPPIAKA